MAFKDLFKVFRETLDSPANNANAVTPDDATDVDFGSRAVYVGGAGDLVVTLTDEDDGTNVTFSSVPAGTVLPIRVKRVWATNTTATDIVLLY